MQSNLYLIENRVNDKLYVGQTYGCVNRRFTEHISSISRYPNRPLYKAMAEIGIENFSVRILEVCDTELADTKEIEYINKFNSFHNGYNATKGGEGRKLLDLSSEEVRIKYFELDRNLSVTASHFGVDQRTIKNRLNKSDIKFRHTNRVRLNDMVFNSVTECAEFLLSTGLPKTDKVEIVRRSLSRHLNGNRQSYLGMKFTKE